MTRDEVLRAVAAHVAHEGIAARPLRQVIALLTDEEQTLETLVHASGLPRRTVESLLLAMEPDLAGSPASAGTPALAGQPGGLRLAENRVSAYRERFGYQQLKQSQLADPLGRRLAAAAAARRQAEADIAAAPAGSGALDHVAATAETAVRRALWLDSSYDLAGARLLCAGDHDLTSLTVCGINPGVEVMVLDVDERILEFIDRQAIARRYAIRCLFADFRLGLPEAAAGWADLVVTDPPFTPEGVRAFLDRGLRSLRDHRNGRIVMACGYSKLQPSLGLKIQREVHDLHLVFEAILPGFNRYHGAQAVGSASELYVLQPTPATWPPMDRREPAATNIYTRGAHSLEGAREPPGDTLTGPLWAAASGPGRLPVTVVAGEIKPETINGAPQTPARGATPVSLAALLATGLPEATRRRPVVAAVDLSADPGAWLLRALLAINADRAALLLPNGHPDLATQAGQRELTGLLETKYALKLRRSTPDSKHAIVEAVAVDTPQPPGDRLARRLLERAHGKVGNIWREALIELRRSGSGPPLTKNDARAAVRQAVSREALLDERLLDLPRHLLRELLADVIRSAAPAGV